MLSLFGVFSFVGCFWICYPVGGQKAAKPYKESSPKGFGACLGLSKVFKQTEKLFLKVFKGVSQLFATSNKVVFPWQNSHWFRGGEEQLYSAFQWGRKSKHST